MVSIHDRIKARRVAMGFASHKALADLLGISWQTVQLWEKPGGTAPKRNRIDAVAAALQVSPQWLLTGRDAGIMIDTVGDRLKKAMREAGVRSQADLARESGVPQPTISRILNNQGEPEAGTIKRLANACKVKFDWLNEGATVAGAFSPLSDPQKEWLALMEFLGTDDINEFTNLIRERQDRNKRLLNDLKAHT